MFLSFWEGVCVMSFFDKVFASVGIGGAKIDARFASDTFTQGEKVDGIVVVKGGNLEQNIDSLYLSIFTNFMRERDGKKYSDTANLGQFRITDSFVIRPNETREIPFSFILPDDTPISYGRTKIWISTGADIKNALDPTDKDYIKVYPNEIAATVINEIANLGFRLRNADCELAPRYLRGRLPIIQEFEFVPYDGPFRGKFDEVEIVFFNQSKESVDVLIEVDRRARGLGGFLAEAIEMDETRLQMHISKNDFPYLKEKMVSLLRRYS